MWRGTWRSGADARQAGWGGVERSGGGQRRCGRNGDANRSGGGCEVLGGDQERGTRRWAGQGGAVWNRPGALRAQRRSQPQRRRLRRPGRGSGAGDAAMGGPRWSGVEPARSVAGATAQPTAAGATAKSWERKRRWAGQAGAVWARPSPACGPLPRPSQQRRGGWSCWFARNVSGRLGRLSRAPRTARVNRPSAAPPMRSCRAFASHRSPATFARARPAAGCRRCRAPRSLRRSRRTTAPT